MRKLYPLFLSLCLLLAAGRTASAQASAYAALGAPDVSAFPEMSVLLDVFDSEGQFVLDLEAGNVTLLEDGQPRPLEALTPIRPGARIIVAVNPGTPFSVRDGEGITRYERARNILRTWAEAIPEDTADSISLVTAAGPQTFSRPVEWLENFSGYQPDFSRAIPNLQSLAFALDTAAAPTTEPGTKSAILYITSHFDERDISTLEALQAELVENRVRVFVWFIDGEAFFEDPTAVAVKALAQQTGGQFFAFSGTEVFPDVESYFAPLRHAYLLNYSSGVNIAGSHSMEAQVKAGGLELTTPQQAFDVDVQPPNPFLVAPPLQIIRRPPADDPYNDEIFVPNGQTLELIIEFPDGHVRPLVRTALYVDEELVAINEQEPFDRLTWDLSKYTSSGKHELKVEAVDSLGLARISLSVPVTVTVIPAPRGFTAFLARYRTPITAGAIVLAGMLLVAILFWGRILRIPGPGARREARQRYADPVTQPITIPMERNTQPRGGTSRLPWVRRPKVPQAPAYLARLNASGEPTGANPIPLLAGEMTFGTDPVQATYILDDPSVSPLHARLRQTEEGAFILSDQDSIAGTWVNYEPIDREGRRLEHGNRIHFGQLVYRFMLRKAPEAEGPTVTLEETPE